MGLFAKEQGVEGFTADAPQRMLWTRELGTRKLVLGFIAIIVLWWVSGQILDHFLLQKSWPALSPDTSGLTVVGTLDGRSYDQNMFRIVQANETSKVELTNRGWNDIFDGKNGPVFDDAAGNAIRSEITVDDQVGYAMLEPYLRYAVGKYLKKSVVAPTKQTLIPVQESLKAPIKQVPLGDLIDKYSGIAAEVGGGSEEADSSGGNEHAVDHGLAIPATTLIHVCPVVMTSTNFRDAAVEENPGSLLQKKTVAVHLYLTPEGRSRFYQWSHDHAQEDLVFVLRDHVVIAGRIHQTMDVNDWQIGPMRDEAAAKELVDFIKSRSK